MSDFYTGAEMGVAKDHLVAAEGFVRQLTDAVCTGASLDSALLAELSGRLKATVEMARERLDTAITEFSVDHPGSL